MVLVLYTNTSYRIIIGITVNSRKNVVSRFRDSSG